jgi:hypothetical protein
MLRKLINRKNYFLPSPIIDKTEANYLLFNEIKNNKPLMVSRFGLTELYACKNYLDIQKTTKGNIISKNIYRIRGYANHWKENVKNEINELSGVFPLSDSQLNEFALIYLRAARLIDILAIWNMSFETYFTNSLCPNARLIEPAGIEPYYHQNPWSYALKDKKVLLIHPFTSTIKKQYLKHETIFENRNVLPKFELKTLQAVQSLANNPTSFSSWTEAFNYQCNQIDEIEFDIAIIGAGAYGLPLAAHVKNKGRIAVHMGGATQILFGIKGKRWAERPEVNKFYNEHWIYPDKSEYPLNFKKTDNGCYW